MMGGEVGCRGKKINTREDRAQFDQKAQFDHVSAVYQHILNPPAAFLFKKNLFHLFIPPAILVQTWLLG